MTAPGRHDCDTEHPGVSHMDWLEERWRTTPSLLERMGVHTLRASVRRAQREGR